MIAQESGPTTSMPWESNLGLIKNVTLNLNDDVTDECWTNADLIRSNTFLSFEQNDIFVPDYDVAFYNYNTAEGLIDAFGYRTASGICAVSAQFRIQTISSDTIGGYGSKEAFHFEHLAVLFEKNAIFTSSTTVNLQLKDFYEGAVSEFLARSISQRRNADFKRYLSIYPASGEIPMSREQWRQMIDEFTADISQLNDTPD